MAECVVQRFSEQCSTHKDTVQKPTDGRAGAPDTTTPGGGNVGRGGGGPRWVVGSGSMEPMGTGDEGSGGGG
eukprot:COSAG01_NODE_651_length_14494_cov_37.478119_2_plen_72_part_00